MGFVDYDQPDVGEWGEESAARTNDNRKLTTTSAPPGIITFASGET